MPVILIKLLRPLAPYLLGVGLIAAAFFYVAMLRHDLSALSQKNADLVTQNAENLAAIAIFKQDQASWNAAADSLAAQTLSTNTAANDVIEKIRAAPVTSDAPVAPVLAQALDGLRALQGGAP